MPDDVNLNRTTRNAAVLHSGRLTIKYQRSGKQICYNKYISIYQKSAFEADQISKHIDRWNQLTTDGYILDMVRGCHIEFHTIPIQYHKPSETKLSNSETDGARNCQPSGKEGNSSPCCEEFISTIFLRPRKIGHTSLS